MSFILNSLKYSSDLNHLGQLSVREECVELGLSRKLKPYAVFVSKNCNVISFFNRVYPIGSILSIMNVLHYYPLF